MSRGDTNLIVLLNKSSISCQRHEVFKDFLVGNQKFDVGGCCEMMAFRIIRTRGSYKQGLTCGTSLLKILLVASKLCEWKSGQLAFYIIRTRGSYKQGLTCGTSLLKILLEASELCEWKSAKRLFYYCVC